MNRFSTTNCANKNYFDITSNSVAGDNYLGISGSKQSIRNLSKMSDKPVGRPMKFPYTFSAKIAQFPLKYHIKNQWIWRYYFISLAICAPIFYKISKLSNSPENKAKWAEMKKKEAAEHH